MWLSLYTPVTEVFIPGDWGMELKNTEIKEFFDDSVTILSWFIFMYKLLRLMSRVLYCFTHEDGDSEIF